jgi:hypothetical protein
MSLTDWTIQIRTSLLLTAQNNHKKNWETAAFAFRNVSYKTENMMHV